jgi:phytoene synthase
MVTLERIDAGSALISRRGPGSVISPAEEAAIAQRTDSPPFFWSMQLLAGRRRKAMQALYLFCREVDDVVAGEASQPLKLALLADWRTEIALVYAGRPQHVVARALRNSIETFDLKSEDLLAIINGMEMDARADIRAPSVEQLDLYCEQRAMAVSRIALRIFGAARADAERTATALGRGLQLTVILRDLVKDAARQRLYLPRELLRAHDIFATMPGYVLAQPGLPQVCNALAERAAGYLVDAQRAVIDYPKWAMLVTTAALGSYRTLLKALRPGAGPGLTSRSAFRAGANRRCTSDTLSLAADRLGGRHYRCNGILCRLKFHGNLRAVMCTSQTRRSVEK